MDEREFIEKSMTLSFEFQRYLIAHPTVAESIPKDAQVLFLLEDDPEFNEHEMRLVERFKREDTPVVIVKIESIMPPFESRLVNPRIKFGSSV